MNKWALYDLHQATFKAEHPSNAKSVDTADVGETDITGGFYPLNLCECFIQPC